MDFLQQPHTKDIEMTTTATVATYAAIVATVSAIAAILNFTWPRIQELRASRSAVFKALQGQRVAIADVAYKVTQGEWDKRLGKKKFREKLIRALSMAFTLEGTDRVKAYVVKAILRLKDKGYATELLNELKKLEGIYLEYDHIIGDKSFKEKRLEPLQKLLTFMSTASQWRFFYRDPETVQPHNHDVTEEEVRQVLARPGEDLPAAGGARMALGRTAAGCYLRVIYVPDPEPESGFVVTAYELRGKQAFAKYHLQAKAEAPRLPASARRLGRSAQKVGRRVVEVALHSRKYILNVLSSPSSSTEEAPMTEQKFPPDWDEARVQRLLAHYEKLDEDAQVAEDEAALEAEGQTLMAVPSELVPTIRELVARRTSA